MGVKRTNTDGVKTAIQSSTEANFGGGGCILIDDTVEHTGPFRAISALEDAEVDISECDMSWIEDVADFTIPKGLTIVGRFSSIELDSGKVLAYRL